MKYKCGDEVLIRADLEVGVSYNERYTFEKKCTKLRSGLEFPTKSWQYIEEADK